VSLAVEIASGVCLGLGAALCVIGGIGILRLPDLYTRTHAATITDTLGAGLLLIGLMFLSGLSLVTVKLVLVLAFMWITGPTASHALVHAAHVHGLDPEVIEDSDELPG
jgi:multicomponent Na+:H+ antiporter subunit G